MLNTFPWWECCSVDITSVRTSAFAVSIILKMFTPLSSSPWTKTTLYGKSAIPLSANETKWFSSCFQCGHRRAGECAFKPSAIETGSKTSLPLNQGLSTTKTHLKRLPFSFRFYLLWFVSGRFFSSARWTGNRRRYQPTAPCCVSAAPPPTAHWLLDIRSKSPETFVFGTSMFSSSDEVFGFSLRMQQKALFVLLGLLPYLFTTFGQWQHISESAVGYQWTSRQINGVQFQLVYCWILPRSLWKKNNNFMLKWSELATQFRTHRTDWMKKNTIWDHKLSESRK